jgi:hypothetical protein
MVPPFKFGVVAFIVAAGCILHLHAYGYQDDVLHLHAYGYQDDVLDLHACGYQGDVLDLHACGYLRMELRTREWYGRRK